MENNMLLKYLEDQFFRSFSMLEKTIEICPDELWNSKKSGFVFWQLLIHTFAGMYGWLREEKLGYIPFNEINGKKIYIEFEKEPEIFLTKWDIIKCCNETKGIVEKWFSGKDDEWLKSPYKIYNKRTNFDTTVGQIEHMMYHIGYCDAIFRENGMEKGVWNE
jgi:hypothetical protein